MRLARIAPRILAALGLVAGAVAFGGSAPAPGAAGVGERIVDYDVDITIEDDGSLLVTETIQYDFGVIPKHGIFRDIPVRYTFPDEGHHDRVYELDVEEVRATEGHRRSTPSRPPATTSGSRSATPTAPSPASTGTRSPTACAVCSTRSPSTTSCSGTRSAPTGRSRSRTPA